jgi:hypothetical protein
VAPRAVVRSDCVYIMGWPLRVGTTFIGMA